MPKPPPSEAGASRTGAGAHRIEPPDPRLWRRIEEIFEAAVELAPEERAAFLAGACGDDRLRCEVDRLLAADGRATRFLDPPARDPPSPDPPESVAPTLDGPPARSRGDPGPRDDERTPPLPWIGFAPEEAPRRGVAPWIRALLALAAIRVTSGVAAAAADPALWATDPAFPFPRGVFLVNVLAFAGVAGWLLAGGRSDRRPVFLAGAFLLIASAFCDRLLQTALDQGVPSLPAALFSTLLALPLDSFLPVFFWLFAREFPRLAPFGQAYRIATFLVRSALVAAVALLGVNAAVELSHAGGGDVPSVIGRFARARFSLLWAVVFALALPALPFMLWRARRARPEERRRVALFTAGLALGLGPLFAEVLLEVLIPPFGEWMDRPAMRAAGGLVLYPLLLSTPFSTAYAVLVHRVLDVELVIRQALRYAFARGVVVTVAVVPFAGLLVYVYRRRDEPVAALVTGAGGLVLVAAGLAGLVALGLREPILAALDRHFFRDRYDARQILTDLVERSRDAGSPEDLAGLLARGVDRALHLESVAVLVLDRATHAFVSPDGGVRPLDASSTLASSVAAGPQPLEVDLERPSSAVLRCPEAERHWLADGGFRVLVPLLGSAGAPIALLALGARRSELPFSAEDRSLLVAVAGAAALALENRLLLASPGPEPARSAGTGAVDGDACASECVACRAVSPPAGRVCPACGGALDAAPVPYVLAGKFRFERRVGAGGMGVVYRAVDLVLGRPVAVKTLPRLSPERALRLRREARTMAAVSHPHLALIFGAETWHGTPLLIFEYLEGGTLADVLDSRRLDVDEALELGTRLAGALVRIHRAGILHRDVKPSNVGFTAERVPKILDFGLARVLDDPTPRRQGRGEPGREPGASPLSFSVLTTAGVLVGTPAYMSPETLRGEPPDPCLDLWSLTLVLYQAVAGVHPFAGPDLEQTLQRIRRARAPDVREHVPGCPDEVARFFRDGLARRRRRRPATANELKRRLESLRQAVEPERRPVAGGAQ